MKRSAVLEKNHEQSHPASSCYLCFIVSDRYSGEVSYFCLIHWQRQAECHLWIAIATICPGVTVEVFAVKQASHTRNPDSLHQKIPTYFVRHHKSDFAILKVCLKTRQPRHQCWQTSGKTQMKGDPTLATPCKYVTVVPFLLLHLRSFGPNADSSWHMAMASTWVIRSQRSKGWPIGYECYLRWLSKLRKWMSFMLTLGWIRWGIWGSTSLVKGNSKYNQ